MLQKTLQIQVFGRVQGVHFRDTVKNYADILNLSGYVENLTDGSVNIEAHGPEYVLSSFLKLVEHGSLLSKVEGLRYQWLDKKTHNQGFWVKKNPNIIIDQVLAFSNLGKTLLTNNMLKMPQHVAIIPDGNRRWARERNLPTFEGHRKGFDRLSELSKTAREAGINTITAWGFSTENWDRDKLEIDYLFKIFNKLLNTLSQDAHKHEVRFRHLGRKDRLPEKIVVALEKLELATKNYGKNFFNLALDYGGRDEILRGINKLFQNNKIAVNITDKLFSSVLDTHDIPDPDYIIRTSGEQRLSGLLPWQGTYAELYFSPVYFPDFDTNQFKIALWEYSQRQRRFGK